MAVVMNKSRGSDPFNVLLIGNNPIELSSIYEQLVKVKDRRIIAETAFDLQSALKSKLNFKPSFILIDDNVGKIRLKELVDKLTHEDDIKEVPITILKNSNYQESAEGAQEYILKHNINGESITKVLLKSLHLKRKQKTFSRTNKGKIFFK